MTPQRDRIQNVTRELNEAILDEQLDRFHVDYRPVPYAPADPNTPRWRVRFDLAFDPSRRVGLDVYDEVIIGREGPGLRDVVTFFSDEDAVQLGLSRRHALLRPTAHQLYIIDLDSTNGTWLNGKSIGVHMPYALSEGDHLQVGRMELNVHILSRPHEAAAATGVQPDPGQAVMQIAQALTSRLNEAEVLQQAVDLIIAHTAASEASIWLVDEQSGELLLRVGQGMAQSPVLRLPVTDTLAGRALQSGQTLRANRDSADSIKVKTGYLVEAVIYVPLVLGGVTVGVLSAVHRENGQMFSTREESVMEVIAQFTATAVQNARVHEAADRSLKQTKRMMSGVKHTLAYGFKKLMNHAVGYAGLLADDETLTDEQRDLLQSVLDDGREMLSLTQSLVEMIQITEDPLQGHGPCDLLTVLYDATDALRTRAGNHGVQLHDQVIGDPYLIQGSALNLYHSLRFLVENVLLHTPPGEHVRAVLVFWDSEIILHISQRKADLSPEDTQVLSQLSVGSHHTPIAQQNGADFVLHMAFAESVIEAHRGTLVMRQAEGEDAVPGSLEFVVKLPTNLRLHTD